MHPTGAQQPATATPDGVAGAETPDDEDAAEPRARLTIAEAARLPATVSVPEAAKLLGISKTSYYEAAHRGELPILHIGRRMVVPTVPILERLGIRPAREHPTAAGHAAGGHHWCAVARALAHALLDALDDCQEAP